MSEGSIRSGEDTHARKRPSPATTFYLVTKKSAKAVDLVGKRWSFELRCEIVSLVHEAFIDSNRPRSDAATLSTVCAEMRAPKVRQPAEKWAHSPVPLRQGALPRERVTNYGLQIVELRLPSQCGSDAVAGGHDLGGIARPTARELHREIHAGDTLHGLVLSAR
jgi:hypothetical protein